MDSFRLNDEDLWLVRVWELKLIRRFTLHTDEGAIPSASIPFVMPFYFASANLPTDTI
jgi:hypothetical protein